MNTINMNDHKPELSNSLRKKILTFVYTEAEYILNVPNTYRRLYSWDPYIHGRYGPNPMDRFRISNIWTHIVLSFISSLIFFGIISIVLWYPAAQATLLNAYYYIGIVISFILTIAYLMTRKPLERWLLKISPNQRVGTQRHIYLQTIILLLICFILFILQLIWLPYAIFVSYFMVFNGIYTFIIMLVYLRMRLSNREYMPVYKDVY